MKKITIDPKFYKEYFHNVFNLPYPYIKNIDINKIRNFILHEINSSDIVIDEVVSGAKFIAAIKSLPWDSKILGIDSCSIRFILPNIVTDSDVYFTKLLKKVDLTLRDKKIKYAFTRLPSIYIKEIMLLEDFGFRFVDSILTFIYDQMKNKNKVNFPNDVLFKYGCNGYDEEIISIAKEIYKFDRFHNDPIIPKTIADDLHGIWLKNSCRKIAADDVVIAIDTTNNKVAGFVTVKIDSTFREYLGLNVGVIILVGVNPIYQGKGIGYFITMKSLEWFQDNNVDFVLVGTQLSNIPASRLYEKIGFRLINSLVSLRKIY